jgi:hypothetical protein
LTRSFRLKDMGRVPSIFVSISRSNPRQKTQ